MYGNGNPLNDEYVNNIKNQMRKLNDLSEQVETSSPDHFREAGEKILDSAITSKNNDAVIIVGHMKDGDLLLPTGARLKISDLQLNAEKNNKKLLVIACNTIDGVEDSFSGLVSIDTLDYRPVLEGIKRAESMRCASDCEVTTIGDYIFNISESLAFDVRLDKEDRTKLKVVLSITSSGAGVGVIISAEGHK